MRAIARRLASGYGRWSRRRRNATGNGMTFTLAPDLAAVVRPALLWLDHARVVERDPRLDAPLAGVEAEMRALLGDDSPSAGAAQAGEPDLLRQRIQSVRTMYKQVGIDPTK